jgi:hypothetical protein
VHTLANKTKPMWEMRKPKPREGMSKKGHECVKDDTGLRRGVVKTSWNARRKLKPRPARAKVMQETPRADARWLASEETNAGTLTRSIWNENHRVILDCQGRRGQARGRSARPERDKRFQIAGAVTLE